MTDDRPQVLNERGAVYGKMEDNARVTQQLMDVVMSGANAKALTPMHKECLHMVLHKISRMVNGNVMYVDNATDMVGYSRLLEEWLIANPNIDGSNTETPSLLREQAL